MFRAHSCVPGTRITYFPLLWDTTTFKSLFPRAKLCSEYTYSLFLLWSATLQNVAPVHQFGFKSIKFKISNIGQVQIVEVLSPRHHGDAPTVFKEKSQLSLKKNLNLLQLKRRTKAAVLGYGSRAAVRLGISIFDLKFLYNSFRFCQTMRPFYAHTITACLFPTF